MTENYLNILAETIRTNWDAPALTDFYLMEDGTAQDTSRGNHYTYGEMYGEICRVAELLTSLGLQKGDHIAICGTNSAHWVIAYLAIAKMQGVSVTVMHSLMPDEIARLINFSDAKALFTDEDIWRELKSLPLPLVENIISLENFESLASGTSIIVSSASCPSSVSSASSETSASIVSFPQSNPDSLAMICFTSGTSGNPKGVMLSSANVSNNVYQAFLLYPQECNTAFFSFLPFTHMAGLIGDMLSQLSFGKNIHILQEAITKYNIISGIKNIAPYMFVSVPAIFAIDSNSRKDNILEALSSSCKLIFMGGSKIEKNIEQNIIDSKIPLSLIYGQTETGASISISPYKQHRLGSCGKIVSGMTARISPAGEILVKGENVMLGYYKDPEATAQKIDSDGWLHTGDKGHLDEDGYLYVEGRLNQDMIVLPNGENIRPDNIEALINALPEVSESIVLARDGKLVAIVVAAYSQPLPKGKGDDIRRAILRAINPQLPLFSQLYDVEITDKPLARTEKQTIKRYLYN